MNMSLPLCFGKKKFKEILGRLPYPFRKAASSSHYHPLKMSKNYMSFLCHFFPYSFLTLSVWLLSPKYPMRSSFLIVLTFFFPLPDTFVPNPVFLETPSSKSQWHQKTGRSLLSSLFSSLLLLHGLHAQIPCSHSAHTRLFSSEISVCWPQSRKVKVCPYLYPSSLVSPKLPFTPPPAFQKIPLTAFSS